MVRPIVIEFDFYVGLHQFSVTWQTELHILDVDATGHPHTFIIGLDRGCDTVFGRCCIEVCGLDEHRQTVLLHQIGREGEEEV